MNARHGVFAPTNRLRDKVVPRPPSTIDGAEPPAEPQVSKTSPPPSSPAASPKSRSVSSTNRLECAALHLPVFGVEVLQCSRCQGKTLLIACIEDPDMAKGILEQLVSRRYERGSFLITTNQPVTQWGTVFGDGVTASAILDRLLHHLHTVMIQGDSYRLKQKRKAGLCGTTSAKNAQMGGSPFFFVGGGGAPFPVG